jgi:hypothetical protein
VGTAYAIKPAYFFLGRKTFMAPVIDRRVTAQIEGDFVVFLIGMRINKPWKPHKWLLNLRTMPKMLKELEAAPAETWLYEPGSIVARSVLSQLRSP